MLLLRRMVLVLVIGIAILLIAAQILSSFLIKPILERQARRLFQVPIHIDKAGTNLFGGSFWMKGVRIKNAQGFQEPDVLSARTISVDFNLLSFLTNEFVVDRILLKDPQFTFEINEQGQLNLSPFVDRILNRFKKLTQKKPTLVRSESRYVLEKFAVRNGMVQFIDRRQIERNVAFKSISFSLARVVYPPDAEEALPAAIYMNATAQGTQEGMILVLGRFNPFASKKSFDISGSAKGLALNDFSIFMPNVPLHFVEGTLQLKVKALCHDNQVDLYHQVRIENLRVLAEEFPPREKPLLVFGLAPEAIVHFFNDLRPGREPFEFDFRVAGDLSDPKFNVLAQIHDSITDKMKSIIEAAQKIVQETVPPATSLRGGVADEAISKP